MELLTDSEDEIDYQIKKNAMYNNYNEINLSEVIKAKHDTLQAFCDNYKNIKTTGEIKDLERRWGNYWCKFSLYVGSDKITCTTNIYNAELINNKIYTVYGNMHMGMYGIEFKIKKMDIKIDELSDFEQLYSKCVESDFLNKSKKKQTDLSCINKIALISKEGTQGYTDFIEHLKLPILYDVYNVNLEGSQTAKHIMKVINEINSTNNNNNNDNSINNYDLILILRGGGDTSVISKSFDVYELFECIKNSNIPVATAIGHTRDKNKRLLINEISDINFNTPTSAASDIYKENLTLFLKLKDQILYKYSNIIKQRKMEVNDYFEQYVEKQTTSIENKLEKIKEKMIKSILPGPVINMEDFPEMENSYVFVPSNNCYLKYKIEKTDEINIDPNMITMIEEIESIDDVNELLNTYISYKFNKSNITSMQKILKSNETLQTKIEKYDNIQAKMNKYYLIPFPNINMKNINEIKELILYYEELLDNSIDNLNIVNLDYFILLKKYDLKNVDETVDIPLLISKINYIIQ